MADSYRKIQDQYSEVESEVGYKWLGTEAKAFADSEATLRMNASEKEFRSSLSTHAIAAMPFVPEDGDILKDLSRRAQADRTEVSALAGILGNVMLVSEVEVLWRMDAARIAIAQLTLHVKDLSATRTVSLENYKKLAVFDQQLANGLKLASNAISSFKVSAEQPTGEAYADAAGIWERHAVRNSFSAVELAWQSCVSKIETDEWTALLDACKSLLEPVIEEPWEEYSNQKDVSKIQAFITNTTIIESGSIVAAIRSYVQGITDLCSQVDVDYLQSHAAMLETIEDVCQKAHGRQDLQYRYVGASASFV